MAETLISPGVLARENDQSFVTSQPVVRGASIIGPTVLGPVERPTYVSSFSSFQAIFGGALKSGSGQFTYLTSIAANQYFQNGGESLLVTRVVSASATWAPATSSLMETGSGGPTTGLAPFVLETISQGEIMNTTGSMASGAPADGTNGQLLSGSANNVRWEIAATNTASGVFSLLVRRGNDTQNQKVVLEQYNNISLDPFASNYIERAIGNMTTTVITEGTDTFIQDSGSYNNISNYIRVKQVNYATPEYFNNDGSAKDEYTGSLPVVGSGSYGGSFGAGAGSNISTKGPNLFYELIDGTSGAANTQGLIADDYTTAIALMGNVDDYQYNVISVPGLTNQITATPITSLVNNTIARGDSIFVLDLVRYNQAIATVINQSSGFDSSYAATYWPWVQTIDPNTGQMVFVPPSTFIPGVYAFTDASSDPWFAPAGITRGGMGQVVKAERKLTSNNRDTLYEANVNPIATFPGQGVVVFGQKTLQKAASALDRINVRRLLITLKDYISQISDNLVFEQNTIATRQNFLTQVNPYLESVQQRQGLYAFKVVMDESNNTPDVIDRNELIGQIFLQPTKTAEFIILDFNVLPTGATFPA